jgi:aspartyl-tRNA(Asn)/glutamyl-tRNA(Gln) amidotransferase subunit B
MEFLPTIGLEVHAELQTESKMFCACPVVDATRAEPNSAVCPVCAGMPGVLPVLNARAVEYALRVALALGCEINRTSLFARKNYFYPDLPKGYQISQYEQPLARHGILPIQTPEGERPIRIRRVHLEEDTGRLVHAHRDGESYSLVDLNRAGIPLLEIVTEPDLHSAEEARACGMALRSLLRYLGVNSGDMQKGVMRVEPNVSVRPAGAGKLGTRVEVKNLNSFRALERAVAYEIARQSEVLRQGRAVRQETVGWDEASGSTFTQRVKEGEDDYRYFPEPDLPPLALEPGFIEQVRAGLPELPAAKYRRFQEQFGLSAYDAGVLVADRPVADYYEETAALAASSGVSPKTTANWITGELFGLMKEAGADIAGLRIAPQALAELLGLVERGEINGNTAKTVLGEMFNTGKPARAIVSESGLGQISDAPSIAALVARALENHPQQVQDYLAGKTAIARWLFGQVMRLAGGQANPKGVQAELDRQLEEKKGSNQ